MSNLAVIDNTQPRPQLVAGHTPRAIVPQTMEEAYRLANAVCEAGMAPRGLDTPAKAMVAIMHGLEIGLTPMAALQRIAVVNGRPTIWGDGAMSLVRASGLCEYVKERIDGEGDKRVGVCEAKRKGEPDPIIRTFSVQDAKNAGLWGKAGPWQQYANRMLAMRARAFTLRDGFADVLGGLYLKEELEDVPTHTQARVSAPPPPQMIEAPKPPDAAAHEQPAEVAKFVASVQDKFPGATVERKGGLSFAEMKANVKAALDKATGDTLAEIWEQTVGPIEGALQDDEYQELLGVYRLRESELEP